MGGREAIRGGRRLADHDRIKPGGRGAARRDRIGRTLEPDRLVSQRCQRLLVAQQPLPFALDDEYRLATPERQHRWTDVLPAAAAGSHASKRLPCPGLLCTADDAHAAGLEDDGLGTVSAS